MRRDAVAWVAARTVGAWLLQQVARLEGAKELRQVTESLQAAFDLLICPDLECFARFQSLKPNASEVDDQLQSAVLQQAQSVGWPALQRCFYEDQFELWATTVLTVAAGEWLPNDEDKLLQQLIADTFHSSPAASALAALVGHLSAVLPKHGQQQSSTTVTAIAAGTAAELLAERFAAPGSCGITQLLDSCDQQEAQQSACNNAADSNSTTLQQQQEQQQQHQQQQQQQPSRNNSSSIPTQQQQQTWLFMPCLAGEQIDEAAQQLASIPDRAQQLPQVPALLEPRNFVQHALTSAFLHLVNKTSSKPVRQSDKPTWEELNGSKSSSLDSHTGISVAAAAAAPGAWAFVTRLLQKFITRGYAKQAAAVLLQLAAGDDASVLLPGVQLVLLQLSTHAAAMEKLVVQLLLQSGSPQQQQQQSSSPKQQQQLKPLLCPLFALDANLRTLALSKLLLRRTLPARCLRNLLAVMTAVRPSLVPEAAVILAAAWCDQQTCLNAPVQQQAYMTAALVQCLDLLPRKTLDPAAGAAEAAGAANGTAVETLDIDYCQALLRALKQQAASTATGAAAAAAAAAAEPYQGINPQKLTTLVPSILQGVSMRLASPSPAVRLQAMRVGRGFAAKLDPAKSLFEEAGDLGLMPEEVWPGSVEHTLQQQQGGAVLAAAAAAAGGGGDSQQLSSSSSKFQALNRLQEADVEPDSDDDDSFIPTTPAAAAAVGGGAVHAPLQQQIGFDALTTTDNTTGSSSSSSNGAPGAAAAAPETDSDSASDAGSEASGSSLVAFDLQEDASAEAWWGPDGLGLAEGKPLSLRAVAAALRKHDDVNGVLDALGRVEVLVRAEPDELPVVAPELARSLLHCKVPAWASTPLDQLNPEPSPAQATGLHPSAEIQRQRSLTAVLSLSPLTVGDTLIAELYSPHLDQYQRMLVLDSLAAAAVEMSDPRKAPRLAAAAPGQAPKMLPSAAAAAAAAKQAAIQELAPDCAAAAGSGALAPSGSSSSSMLDRSSIPTTTTTTAAAAAPGMIESSSRVWGKVSLQKQKAAAAAAAAGQAGPDSLSGPTSGALRTFRNRFAPVAVRWASLLLKECDVRKHGIDLFGRDSMLLGRLLTVLGTFVECAAATPAAVPLAAGLLEMLKAPQVSDHKEVFVRRSALAAASQVVRHLPPARLAGAMIGRQQDVQDAVLVEQLQWLMGWAQSVATTDVDEHCRVLAGGCIAWHVELAESAMAALEHLPEPEGPSLSGVRGSGKSVKGVGEGVEIKVPSLQERLVLQ